MKIVLPDATVLDTGTGEGSVTSYSGSTWARGSHGPDLTGIFIGDGGIFGIKVEATYRIFRLPKFKKPGRVVFDTIDQAYEAIYPLWEIDPYLYIQPYSVGMIYAPENMKSLCRGQSEDGWSVVFVSLGNTQEEVDLKHNLTTDLLLKAGGKIGMEKATEHWFNHLWSVRNMGKLASRGPVPLFELYVSRRDALEAIKWTIDFADEAIKKRGISKKEVSHLMTFLPVGTGQGMTSTMMQFDPTDPVLYEKVRDLWTEFLWAAAGRGYIIEGPQGHEAKMKSKYWSPEFSSFMMAMKKMMDPGIKYTDASGAAPAGQSMTIGIRCSESAPVENTTTGLRLISPEANWLLQGAFWMATSPILTIWLKSSITVLSVPIVGKYVGQ